MLHKITIATVFLATIATIAQAADYSHVCKVPANYRGTNTLPNNNGNCDTYMATYSQASGYQGGAWPLHGIDFSQTYDCSSSSALIKIEINKVATEGCCDGNSGAPESTCFVPPAGICLTDADWTGASTLHQCRDSDGNTWFDMQDSQASCTAACKNCPNTQDNDGNQITCNDQSSCTGGECKYDYGRYEGGGTDINDCMKDSSGATTSVDNDNVRGRCYDNNAGAFDHTITTEAACQGSSTNYNSWAKSTWIPAVWTTLSWDLHTCSVVGAQAVSAASQTGLPDFATASCQEVKNVDQNNPNILRFVNQAVKGGCCGSDKKSICWTAPVDYSHICKVPANYVGDHVIPNANSMTCDNYVNSWSVATGFQNDPNKAGTLHGLDFSQTYDCSSSSSAIKDAVNSIASAGAGCCGGNSGAPLSTCSPPPADVSYVCKVHTDYLPDKMISVQPFGAPTGTPDDTCKGLMEKPLFDNNGVGADFSSANDCSSYSDDLKTTIKQVATSGCCGENGKSTCSADEPDPAAKCSSLTCPSGKVLKVSYCANCDGENNGAPTPPTLCSTEKECTASLGQCILTNNGDRISGPDITDEASCTGSYTDRTWKPAVWMTSATTDCASDPCTTTADAATCCEAESSVAPSPSNLDGDGFDSLAARVNIGISTMIFVLVAMMVTTMQIW